jgi:Uma2 family endonuclease
MTAQVSHTAPSLPTELSFAEYLRLYSGLEGVRSEWIGGKVALYPVTNNQQHQNIVFLLGVILHFFLSLRSLGKLIQSGIPMYLGEDKAAREPDLMILLGESAQRAKPTYVDGAADIVVEVVSPESSSRDYGVKFTEYEAAGVREYWLIDPLRQMVMIYHLTRLEISGEVAWRYQLVPHDAQGRFISRLLPNFALDPRLLWQETLPDGAALWALVQAML